MTMAGPAQEDQRRAARIAALCALLVIASFVASKAARDAILLGQFSVQRLPIFIALSAVISLPVIVVAGRLMARHGPARLMPAVNVASAALAVGEWCLLPHYPRTIAVMVYFHLATSGAVLVSGFWSIVNERFDVQSAKRHIGRIGIGATLGGIFGGVLAERTAVHLPPAAILLVLAGLQLVCAATLRRFGRPTQRPEVAPKQEGAWLALRGVARSPLLRNIGGIVVLGAIAAGVMDYVFKADIVAASSHDGLLRSLAIFYTVTSVVTAFIQVAVCGPIIARLGVPRSVATLPITVTAFGVFALLVPIPLAEAIARGAEVVTRNSVYRAGYELLYAPLGEDDKRATKIVLDVGADRLGDLLGAQLVGLIVYLAVVPRPALLVAALATGAVAVALALRLPRNYTTALEASLLARAPAPSPPDASLAAEHEPWITLTGLPSLGQAGDAAPLSLRIRDRSHRKRSQARAPAPAGPGAGRHGGTTSPAPPRDTVAEAIVDLRSGDVQRITRVLAAGLSPELAACAIELVGRDEVARAALSALKAVAPKCTGLMVDALVDPEHDVAIRRRLPAALLAGEPSLAAWGLWRALADASFDVRYRSGAVLARLAEAGHLHISPEDAFEAVRRELMSDASALRNQRLIDDLASESEDRVEGELPGARAGAGLEHVFTVLGFVLPAEPLKIALRAVQHDDPELRGTALEYLESILPTDMRAQLWPLLEGLGEEPAALPAAQVAPAARTPRSHDEILAALRRSYQNAQRPPKPA
jgi:ATP:ADP antiporter, AAA family